MAQASIAGPCVWGLGGVLFAFLFTPSLRGRDLLMPPLSKVNLLTLIDIFVRAPDAGEISRDALGIALFVTSPSMECGTYG